MTITLFEAAAIGVAFVAFSGTLVFFYRFSNRRLLKKILSIRHSAEELKEFVERLNKARHSEIKELSSRMERLEDVVATLLEPEGEHRELAKEKVHARRR